MSYTGAHAQNFIPSPAPAGCSPPAVPADQRDRREVRPLGQASSSVPMSQRQAHTTNLEAQVRVLEQEVHLLRNGLAQNERLRAATAGATVENDAAPQRRVHFGPSSVVPIPRIVPRAATQRKTGTSPSRNPQRRVSSPASVATPSMNRSSRPRLAFGQRVDPSVPRNTHADTKLPSAQPLVHQNTVLPPSVQPHASPPLPVSPSNNAPTTTKATTYVSLSPAPASLRGSNTSGIPLQGDASGATVVAALDTAPPPAPPAATVWASADPHLLYKRAAAAANSSNGSADIIAHYPFRTPLANSTPDQPVIVGGSPAEAKAAVELSRPAGPTAAVPTAAASPIVVTMSSDGWPPRTFAPHAAAAGVSAPPAGSAVGGSVNVPPAPASSSANVPPAPAPAPAPASSAEQQQQPPIPSNSEPAIAEAGVTATNMDSTQPASSPALLASTNANAVADELARQVVQLRDTLAQREELLHRVLIELHDRGGEAAKPGGTFPDHRRTPADEREEQSRRTLRLLTQELLAAQTQLSHARVSYQLVLDELSRRDALPSSSQHQQQQQQEQQQQQQTSAPVLPSETPQSVPPPPTPPSAGAEAATAEVQKQLDAALQKVKAWEDWYASTQTVEGGSGEPTSTATANAAAAATSAAAGSSEAAPSQADAGHTDKKKQKKKKHHAAAGKDEEDTRKMSKSRDGGCGDINCPHCGFHFVNREYEDNGTRGYSSFGSVAANPVPSLTAANGTANYYPAAPFGSAFAFSDALYSQLAHNNNNDATTFPSPSTASSPPPSQQQQQRETNSSLELNKTKTKAEADTPSPAAVSSGTAAPPVSATQQPSPPSMYCSPWPTDTISSQQQQQHPQHYAARPLQPSVSPFCDDLDHAKLQAYRSQQFMTQFARGAAVRELAEAERRVAEERLVMFQQQQEQQQNFTPPPPPQKGNAATPEDQKTKDGTTKRETVDDK